MITENYSYTIELQAEKLKIDVAISVISNERNLLY